MYVRQNRLKAYATACMQDTCWIVFIICSSTYLLSPSFTTFRFLPVSPHFILFKLCFHTSNLMNIQYLADTCHIISLRSWVYYCFAYVVFMVLTIIIICWHKYISVNEMDKGRYFPYRLYRWNIFNHTLNCHKQTKNLFSCVDVPS